MTQFLKGNDEDSEKKTRSPHLILVLDQLAKNNELSSLDKSSILRSFNLAINSKGEQEVGFTRDPEQSFNPRAARILLILLNNAGERDVATLIKAVERAAEGSSYADYLSLDSPLIVSGAFLLDRLRHIHLEQSAETEPVYLASLTAASELTETNPAMSLLLEKAVERMKRNFR